MNIKIRSIFCLLLSFLTVVSFSFHVFAVSSKVIDQKNNYLFKQHQYGSNTGVVNCPLNGFSLYSYTNTTAAMPTPILNQIEGYPVVCMRAAYKGTAITTPPVVPESMVDMAYAFYNTSISTPPNIPSGVIDLSYSFYSTKRMKSYPDFRNSPVDNMSWTLIRYNKFRKLKKAKRGQSLQSLVEWSCHTTYTERR